jgi:tetratricopeptide (TPR) repeat protein
MKKHYTSKELREKMKEDELEVFMEGVKDWFNPRNTISLIVVVLVAWVGLDFYYNGSLYGPRYLNNQNVKGQQEEAVKYYEQVVEKMKAEDWLAAVDQADEVCLNFPSTGSARWAKLAAAQCYLRSKDFEQAKARYTALSTDSDPIFVSEGLTGLGLVLEAQSKYKEAISHYQDIVQKHKDDNLSELWLYRAAFCHEQLNQYKEAIAGYKKISRDFALKDDVERRLAWLMSETDTIEI